MDDPAKTIAVVRGGSTTDVEQTFRTLVDRWQPTVRMSGLIAENPGLRTGLATRLSAEHRDCGTVFDIPGSGHRLDVCHLDGAVLNQPHWSISGPVSFVIKKFASERAAQ